MSLSRHLRTSARALTVIAIALAALTLPTGVASASVTPSCTAAGVDVTSLGGPNFYIDSGATPEFRSGYTGYRLTNDTGAALDDVWVSLSDFTGGSLALASGQAAAQRAGDLDAGADTARFWYLTAGGTSASAQQHTITVYRHNPALPNASVLCTTTNGFASVQGTLAASANKVTGISVTGGTPKLGAVFTVTVTGDTGTIGQGIAGDAQSLWMTPAVVENWPADAFRLIGTSLTISPDGEADPETYTDTLRVAGLGSTGRPYTAAYTFQAIGFTSSPTTVKPVQEIASGTQVKHTGSYSVALPAIQPAVNDLSVTLTPSATKVDHGGGTVTLTGEVAGTAGAELDGFTLTLPAGASVVPGSATWGGTPIDDPVGDGDTKVFTGPFVVGTKKLTVDIAYDGTPGARTATIVGTVGTAQIGSSPSPTDGSNPASATVNVDTAPIANDHQTATRPNEPVTVNTAPLVTDADSDPWTVAETTDPEHGSVSVDGRLITYTPDEDFEGTDSFDYSVDDGRGGTATATITVIVDPEAQPPVEPTSQTITFEQPGGLVVGQSGVLDAVADSGLPVSFTTDTPEICSVVGNEVTAIAAGECSVTAHQDGDETYAPAEPVTRTITVSLPEPPPVDPTPQTIDVDPAATVLGIATPYDVQATATSGLPVSFQVTAGDCTLEGDALSAASAGDCTVEVTQPGDATYAPATPVSATITFTEPADDSASTPGATPVIVDVLDNDPEDVSLDSVGEPAHGTAVLVDGQVRYTPTDSFRGTDTFDYTVAAGGRTAQASVTVTVANQGPNVTGGAVTQLAGTTTSVTLTSGDLNGDPVSLTATSPDPRVGVQVNGTVLTIAAGAAASGNVSLTVTATDGAGGSATSVVTTRITPIAPTGVGRRLSASGTTIRWTAAPTAGAVYEVLVDGRVVCRTSRTVCSTLQIAGPKRAVSVRTLGRDGTRSVLRPAPLTGHGQVLIATIYFASDSARLTAHDRQILDTAIRKVHRYGFGRAALDGYTDADGGLAYNVALSHRRTRTVAGYLMRNGDIGSVQSWHGETNPVASNTSTGGKAKNRRVEVLVRY